MKQEVHIVKVTHLNHLAMMYKIIEQFMLMSAPYCGSDCSLWLRKVVTDRFVEMCNMMRQEEHIVKVINFNHLAMMYRVIKWFMLTSAPVLWIRLLIMAKKGREILYWWYPSVSIEVHIINKRNLWHPLEQENTCNLCECCAIIESYKQKCWEQTAEMSCFGKILQDKHVHPNLYDLSEFVPMQLYAYQVLPRAIRNVALNHHCQGTIVGTNIKDLKIKVIVTKPYTYRIWQHCSNNLFIGRTLMVSLIRRPLMDYLIRWTNMDSQVMYNHHLWNNNKLQSIKNLWYHIIRTQDSNQETLSCQVMCHQSQLPCKMYHWMEL